MTTTSHCALLLLAAGLAGCNSSIDVVTVADTGPDAVSDAPEVEPDAHEPLARLRVVSVDPSPTPLVDATGMPLVDATGMPLIALSNPTFADRTDHLAIPAGGSICRRSSCTETLLADVSYTAFLYGDGELVMTRDEPEAPPTGARLRFVHLAPALAALAIRGEDGSVVLGPIMLAEAGAVSEPIEAPAGSMLLEVSTGVDALPVLSFRLPALPPGTIADVLVTVLPEHAETGAFLTLVDATKGTPPLRIPMATPRIRVLDSTESHAIEIDGLPFEYVALGTGRVAPGNHRVELRVHGTPLGTPAALGADVEVQPGDDVALVAVPDGAALRFVEVRSRPDPRPLGESAFRIVHAAFALPELDVVATDASPPRVIDSLVPGAAGETHLTEGEAIALGFDLVPRGSLDLSGGVELRRFSYGQLAVLLDGATPAAPALAHWSWEESGPQTVLPLEEAP